jgi:hypothetical protein
LNPRRSRLLDQGFLSGQLGSEDRSRWAPGWETVISMVGTKTVFAVAGIEAIQISALKHELLVSGGWLLTFWAMGAASWSGFVLTAFFVLLSTGRILRISVDKVLTTLPKHSVAKHYARIAIAACFFLLLAARGCYIAMVIVDCELRTNI